MDESSPYASALKWFNANGGFFNDGCSIKQSSHGHGIAVYANADINGMDVVCNCPLSLSLSCLNLDDPESPKLGVRHPEIRHISSTLEKLLGHEMIPSRVLSWFVLVEQRLLGSDSFWAPYINALPKENELTTSLWFDDEDMDWLSGTNLHKATQDRIRDWRALTDQALSILKAYAIDPSPYTWENLKWAATIFTSRSFTPKGIFPDHNQDFSLLFPVIDYLNHSNYSRVDWRFSETTFQISHPSFVWKGQEILNNYGQKSNEELLMGYGFCIELNHHDFIPIRPTFPSRAFISKFTQQYLDQQPVDWESSPPIFQISRAQGTDTSTLDAFPPLLAALIYEITFHQNQRPRSAQDTRRRFLDERVRLRVFCFLHSWTKSILTRLMANQERNQSPINSKQRYAAIYRDSQLQIATRIIDKFEKMFESCVLDPNPLLRVDQTGYAFLHLKQVMSLLSTTSEFIHETFVEGLVKAYGTKSASRLHREGNDDEAYILLLAFIRLGIEISCLADDEYCAQSIRNLQEAYPVDAVPEFYRQADHWLEIIDRAKTGGSRCLWIRKLVPHAEWASWVFDNEAIKWDASPLQQKYGARLFFRYEAWNPPDGFFPGLK